MVSGVTSEVESTPCGSGAAVVDAVSDCSAGGGGGAGADAPPLAPPRPPRLPFGGIVAMVDAQCLSQELLVHSGTRCAVFVLRSKMM